MLAREGARVVLTDVNEALGREAAKAIGGDAVFVRHDVSDEESWREVIEATLARFGRLDVLVNNAGIIIVADVESTTVEQWRKIMAVNAEGVFLGCKHAIPAMRRSGGGSIINISSAAGLVGHAAVRGLQREQGRRAHPHEVGRGALPREGRRDPLQLDPSGRHRHADGAPRSRAVAGAGIADIEELGAPGRAIGYGKPADIGHLVLYLASDESRFMNGSELAIDGGLTAV